MICNLESVTHKGFRVFASGTNLQHVFAYILSLFCVSQSASLKKTTEQVYIDSIDVNGLLLELLVPLC